MSKKRSEIEDKYKWNLEAIFASDGLWEDEYKKISEDMKNVASFAGTLSQSAQQIRKAFEFGLNINRRIEKLFIYAHTRHDEDTKLEKYKTMQEKAYILITQYSAMSSFFEPELLAIPTETMDKYIESSELAQYKFAFQKMLRAKEHILSDKEEAIMSQTANIMSAAEDAFGCLNDADMKFGSFTDNHGKEWEITHGQYHALLTNPDREVRRQAFVQYHNCYDSLPTTFASLLNSEVKNHQFEATVRHYDSSLHAALFSKNIDTSVYTNLIETTHKHIGSLHRYMELRRKKMGVDKIHLYDVYVPFIDYPEMKFTYDEAKELFLESTKRLGAEYHDALTKGLNEEGWVDIYENENKRSGAYSTGCYDTHPYILLNFNGTLSDARTLAHEAGHSMHSYLTHKYQPLVYGDYPIFLAEVASTFNEELFINHIMSRISDPTQRAFLINSRLEEIRATFFRQVMFAEFELMIHNFVENGTPLTADLLKSEYHKLNEFYFGPNVEIDKEIDIEWARIPHFYYNFYVYQYATGISAAIALYKRVINGGQKELDDYLGFLKSGNSKYAIDTLRDAGVDMTTPQPIEDLIAYFDELQDQLRG